MARTTARHDLPQQQTQPQVGDTVTGVVARVVSDRGFCFLHASGQDYFCHFTALTNCELKDLVQGVTKVRFLASVTEKGPRAEQVEVL